MILKFRAWDKTEKIMHYDVEKTYDNLFGNPPMSEQSFGEVIKQAQSGKYVLMQCTGLFDKNESELYDMDIVKFWNEALDFPPRISVITWDRTGQWIFDFGDINPIAASDIFHDLSSIGINELFCSMNIEKVGNIFENENLLSKKSKENHMKERNMDNNFLTVDILLGKLKELSKTGYGDMKIKCQDSYLHEDEIGINFLSREMLLRGYLYNFPIAKMVNEFKDDIEKAYRKYYGLPFETDDE